MIVGIDPGLSGALVFFNSSEIVVAHDMPTFELVRNRKKRREIDINTLHSVLTSEKFEHAFIEQVHSMPQMSAPTVFAFGKSYGIVLGVLAALQIPVTAIDPRVWKKALQVPAAKDGARARASQLLPGAAHFWPLVKHDGRAEAALIALYGMKNGF